MPDDLVLHRVDESRHEAFAQIRSWVYRGGAPVGPDENLVPSGVMGYVAYQGETPVGAYSLLDLETWVRGVRVKTAGYAAVAVPVEHRGSAVGQRMMSSSLRPAREEGYVLASLYAFREPFYRKSGFESMGMRLEVTAPPHRLPTVKPELEAIRLNGAQWSQIAPCYEAFAVGRSGLLHRNEWLWERVIGDPQKGGHVLAFGDPIEAYLILEPETGFWSTVRASEFVWLTARGYASARETLRRMAINQSSVEWFEPSDSPMAMSGLDHGIDVKLERPIMVRVLDVKKALESISTLESGRFTIAIEDPDIPENRGPFAVEFSPAGVAVDRSSTASLLLTIGEFSQAFLGEPSLDQIVRFQGAERSADHLAAGRLLPLCRCSCFDFF